MKQRHESGTPERLRLSALVSGSVQGVGYRAFVRRLALDAGLCGYAENLDDGRVEVVAEGERGELEALLHQLRRGPAHAEVRAVDVTWGEASGLEGFHTF
ncbi:acylphosphatase [Truepera radiovictrix]|uniref:acylphosphatase n=1 Tax=Truepera radiovictrix (strain DSM 17093 / CIP 108686 / LMG 22925 / RQ-24) TaxID=649638 RepID=D7CVA1_TRURR|nr:acylphosphatase [Truepera radiovictrix]ADI14129.1 acylphosphatase [Truepera radiovictrix DSM 17093]WMT57310.1 acylphosphatase [Truepera radiovictrix]